MPGDGDFGPMNGESRLTLPRAWQHIRLALLRAAPQSGAFYRAAAPRAARSWCLLQVGTSTLPAAPSVCPKCLIMGSENGLGSGGRANKWIV